MKLDFRAEEAGRCEVSEISGAGFLGKSLTEVVAYLTATML
jgi:hypothetical protein